MFFQALFGGEEDGGIGSDYQEQWNHKEHEGIQDRHIVPLDELPLQCIENREEPGTSNASKDLCCVQKLSKNTHLNMACLNRGKLTRNFRSIKRHYK